MHVPADLDDRIKRDKSHVFKFKVGDRVKKAWRWAPYHNEDDDSEEFGYCRCGGDPEDVPIGTIGTVIEILMDGTVDVEFRDAIWTMGASELDYAPPEMKK